MCIRDRHQLVAVIQYALDQRVLYEYVILLELLIDKVCHGDLYHCRLRLLICRILLHKMCIRDR